MASVDPDMVTILSGQEPSDILILAPDCKKFKIKHSDWIILKYYCFYNGGGGTGIIKYF